MTEKDATARAKLILENMAPSQLFKTAGAKHYRDRLITALKLHSLTLNLYYTQYKKAPTFAVGCEWLENHTYRKGAPL